MTEKLPEACPNKSPNDTPLNDPIVVARFWSRVDVPAPRFDHNPCWNWRGSADRHGYGQFKVKTGTPPKRCHRVAWEIFNGPIPDGGHILHGCDNPRCCNPSHLRVGTHAENMADKQARDRAWKGGPVPALTKAKDDRPAFSRNIRDINALGALPAIAFEHQKA